MEFKFRVLHAQDSGSAGGTNTAPANGGQAHAVAQKSVQNTINTQNMGSENRRRLSPAIFSENSVIPVDIPIDTCIKRMPIEGVIAFTATYASGTPLLSPMGAISRLVPSFSVVADGSRYVKTLDLYVYRCLMALAYEGFQRRATNNDANLASTRQATTEWVSGTSAYPATTESIVIRETIDIAFENYFAYNLGRDITQLYTANLSTCKAFFNCGAVGNLNQDGNSAAVTYSDVDISFTPTIVENRQGGLANNAFDFVETVTVAQYSQQVRQQAFQLNTGNKLVGIGMFVQNGDTNKSPCDFALQGVNLKVNGSQDLYNGTFQELQDDNKGRFGVSDDQYASGKHGLQGFAYLNLLKGGDIRTGVSTKLSDGVSQIQLYLTTAASSGIDAATYTNPVQISVLQQQMIEVPVKQ